MIDFLSVADFFTPFRAFWGEIFLGRKTVVIDLPDGISAKHVIRGLARRGVKAYYPLLHGEGEFSFSVERKHLDTIHALVAETYGDAPSVFMEAVEALFWWLVLVAVIVSMVLYHQTAWEVMNFIVDLFVDIIKLFWG